MANQVVGLEFVVSGEREATAKLKTFSHQQDQVSNSIRRGISVTQRIEGDIRKLTSALQRGTITEKAYKAALTEVTREYKFLNEGVRGNEMSTQKASAAVQKMATSLRTQASEQAKAKAALLEQEKTTRQNAAADAELAREKERLIQKLNPLRSASMLYENELRDINQASSLGVINDRQRQQSLDALNAEFKAFAGGAEGAAMANNRFGVQGQMAGRRTNQLGVLMQQTGYQVGDFAVQVQGGTNVMVALGQQATQLVGTFGMLAKSTRMIGVFAGLGIIIPILTAIGAAFMRARQESDKTADSLTELEDAIKSIDSTLGDWINTKKAAEAGMSVDEMFGTESLEQATANLAEAEAKLNGLLVSSQVRPTGMYGAVALVDAFLQAMAAGDVEDATQAYEAALERLNNLENKLAEERLKNYTEEMTALEQRQALINEAASSGEDSQDVRRLALQQDILNMTKEINDRTDLEQGQKENIIALNERVLTQALNQELIQEAIEASNERQQSQAERNASISQQILEIANARREAISDTNKELSDQALILQAEVDYGKESLEYRDAVNAAERDALDAALRKANVGEDERNRLVNMLAMNQQLTEEAISNADEAERLADNLRDAASAMASLSSFGDGIEKALAVANARIEALRTGADVATAGVIAGYRADLEANTEASLASELNDPIEVLARAAIISSDIDELEARKLVEARLRDANKNSGGGGKSPAEEAADNIEKLREQLALQRELIGATDTQARLLNALGAGYENVYGAEAIADLSAQIELIAELTKEIERQQQVSDILESSMSEAFMSIVDGTDTVQGAFKKMAASIISELYKVLVVQRLVGSFDAKSGTGSGIVGFISRAIAGGLHANGNAFSGGNVIPFANGGVVGGPTTFPMSGGRTGLMGEAGPEAIMPLKRGRDGKLGVAAENGGNVTVVQNFNIAANGDETVKRIVRAETPRMAEAAKAAVLDSKRRGGAYGRSF